MAEYTIGVEVTCEDGACGELRRVVIDPIARVLTHLVVEPKHQQGTGRLVPIDLVDATAEKLCLRCSAQEFAALDHAEEAHFIAADSEQMGYTGGEAFAWPYYGLGVGMAGMGLEGMGETFIEERVPAGEAEVRRGEHVHATDGNIGRVHGLVVDPKDHQVTHVLLAQGHLWGKRTVAIPIGAVKDVAGDRVQLNLTRDEVRDLPPVDLADHS